MGSHLCDHLVQYHNVVCVDNFVSGSQSNINHLLSNPNFEFIKHDMVEPLDLEKFPELDKFKVKVVGIAEIYNLACPTSVKNFEPQRIKTLETSSWGTHNALEVALKYKAKFFHASSSVVYGPRINGSKFFSEDVVGSVNMMSPRACYDEGKRFSESIVNTYHQVYSLDTKIGRIFRTYGPRMPLFDGQMIPDFITNALDDKDLVIYGDKDFKTSLVYVSDVIDGMIKMMESSESGPINLGSPDEFSLYQVAETIIKMIGSKSKVTFEDPLLFMSQLGLPDITLAKEKLGWLPVVRLEEGLQKIIDYTKAEKGVVSI